MTDMTSNKNVYKNINKNLLLSNVIWSIKRWTQQEFYAHANVLIVKLVGNSINIRLLPLIFDVFLMKEFWVQVLILFWSFRVFYAFLQILKKNVSKWSFNLKFSNMEFFRKSIFSKIIFLSMIFRTVFQTFLPSKNSCPKN